MQKKAASEPRQVEEVKQPTKAEPAKELNPPLPLISNPKPDQKAKFEIDKKMGTYNGAATEKYNWSQSIKNVDVQIELPKGTTSKGLLVEIKPKHFKVLIKGQTEPLIQGELCEKVKVEDSLWSVEDQQYLNVNFEKAYEAIWKCVIVGDPEIDPKTVDNSKRVEEFDLETQGHLQKVLYEQNRKKMGLPTTEEEQQQKLMEQIMAK